VILCLPVQSLRPRGTPLPSLCTSHFLQSWRAIVFSCRLFDNALTKHILEAEWIYVAVFTLLNKQENRPGKSVVEVHATISLLRSALIQALEIHDAFFVGSKRRHSHLPSVTRLVDWASRPRFERRSHLPYAQFVQDGAAELLGERNGAS